MDALWENKSHPCNPSSAKHVKSQTPTLITVNDSPRGRIENTTIKLLPVSGYVKGVITI